MSSIKSESGYNESINFTDQKQSDVYDYFWAGMIAYIYSGGDGNYEMMLKAHTSLNAEKKRSAIWFLHEAVLSKMNDNLFSEEMINRIDKIWRIVSY